MNRSRVRIAALALSACAGCARSGDAAVEGRPQPQPAWTRQLGTASDDAANAVATDPAGDVIVAGWTYGAMDGTPGAGGSDLFAAKLDAAGVERWTRRLGTASYDEACSVATDAAGNVYLAGVSGGSFEGNAGAGGLDLVVVKLDAAGVVQWARQLGTPSHDWATSVATDAAGDVLVAGYTEGSFDGHVSHGGKDLVVVKLGADGATRWSLQLGSSTDDYGASVATDAARNVIVAGYTLGGLDGSAGAGGFDLFVVKLDAAGATQWTRQLGTARHDWGMSVAADQAGSVFVGGTTEGALEDGVSAACLDAFVVKYDGAGARQWTRQLSSPECHDEIGRSVATDTQGDVLVAGVTSGSLDGIALAGDLDLFVVRYDGAGALQWTGELGTPGYDEANAVATDASGSALVAGSTSGRLDPAATGAVRDAIVVRYDAAAMAP